MKLDRMLGIVHVLSNVDRITARELADRFEVSLKTIRRDIDAIGMAGIPVVTYPGGNGGVGLAPGYRLDRKALTRDELSRILTGLSGLQSIGYETESRQLLASLAPAGLEGVVPAGGDVLVPAPDLCIDLSSHYRARLAPAIRTLREAITQSRVVRISYLSGTGASEREIEPRYIAFRWSAWYVAGWCRLRDDFRMFKINRIRSLEITDAIFRPRALPSSVVDPNRVFEQESEAVAVLLVHPSAEYRLVDEFGPDSYAPDPSGWLRFSFPYVNREWMLGFIFGLADKARVLEPDALVQAVRGRVLRMAAMYGEDAAVEDSVRLPAGSGHADGHFPAIE